MHEAEMSPYEKKALWRHVLINKRRRWGGGYSIYVVHETHYKKEGDREEIELMSEMETPDRLQELKYIPWFRAPPY